MPKNKNEYDKAYYAKNKEKRKAQIQARNKEHIERNRTWLKEWFSDKSCIDCGLADWRVLQLDHQHNKIMNVGRMISMSYSLKKLQDEVDKCEVVCANCHIIRTGTTFRFWRFAGFA